MILRIAYRRRHTRDNNLIVNHLEGCDDTILQVLARREVIKQEEGRRNKETWKRDPGWVLGIRGNKSLFGFGVEKAICQIQRRLTLAVRGGDGRPAVLESFDDDRIRVILQRPHKRSVMGKGVVFFIYIDVLALEEDFDDPCCILLGINCHVENRETIGGLSRDAGLVVDEKADSVSIPIQYGITKGRIAVDWLVDIIAIGQVLEILSREGSVSDSVCNDGHGDGTKSDTKNR